MSPETGRAFILVVSKREALASAIREHVSTATADLQSVGGPEEARRYAQRHTPASWSSMASHRRECGL